MNFHIRDLNTASRKLEFPAEMKYATYVLPISFVMSRILKQVIYCGVQSCNKVQHSLQIHVQLNV